jgi:hypothetical protein
MEGAVASWTLKPRRQESGKAAKVLKTNGNLWPLAGFQALKGNKRAFF